MKIGLVQISSLKGDIAANILKHCNYIEQAAKEGVGMIVFPELSLTNYEPSLAAQLATYPGDKRLAVFQQLSDQHQIIIAVGIPIRSAEGTRIGLVIFQPGKERECYTKQYLHMDEFPYFVAGEKMHYLELKGEKIALAICYELSVIDHITRAHKDGATLYVASVAKTKDGLEHSAIQLPVHASKFNIPILMANSVGPADHFIGAGGSAAWNRKGELYQSLGEEEGLLIINTTEL
ncbi:carbon-nitrogen hydrolase family protein [Flavihumibacter rivuli]|uniref:carbon-nitrogen hydrolase family protein n=1 Tax=Flavihumibacter rivuli TaxID=2838156 RepID=UPI001BDE6C54|nr:carbon-nitrogen hydrolase family protein [Flavihumibacter rivuli]ULQ55911.1 carbon-nitrogen hydrolase family protein [Flavihumibacter rivuli]